jgi:hypothetical protein
VTTPRPTGVVPSSEQAAQLWTIADLAQRERWARDAQDWALLEESYYPQSRIFLTWFDGPAAEFVAASRAMAQVPGGHATHDLGPTLVDVNGDRALADTRCAILFRREFEGVACELTAYCRHVSRVEREDGRWRLRTLVGVYEKNTLAPVVPGTAPRLDLDRLATYRRSYDFQAYHRAQSGHTVHHDRPGVDRPDLMERLVEADRQWLSGADVELGVAAP